MVIPPFLPCQEATRRFEEDQEGTWKEETEYYSILSYPFSHKNKRIVKHIIDLDTFKNDRIFTQSLHRTYH